MTSSKRKIRTTISIMLMAMLLMAIGVVNVFADTCRDQDKVDLTKAYKLMNNGTSSPEETFTFRIEKVGVKDVGKNSQGIQVTDENMPTFADSTVEITHAGHTATSDNQSFSMTNQLTLPEYDAVGYYKYRITEVAGSTAGVTYQTTPVILTVAVVNCQDTTKGHKYDTTYTMKLDSTAATKVTNIENTFGAGKLSVSKKVTGIFGDVHKDFDMTVTFTAPAGKTVNTTITHTKGILAPGAWTNGNATTASTATANFTLHDGETVTFTNIPYDVTYEVTEADYTGANGGYDKAQYSYSDPAKKIDTGSSNVTGGAAANSKDDTVTVTNAKGGNIATGIYHNVLMLVVGLAAVVTMLSIVVARRRRSNQA